MATPDSFFAVTAICQNLADMHNNLRSNVQIIQASQAAGTLKIPVDQALQDLGKALQQRLALNDVLVAKYTQPLKVDPTDIQSIQAALRTTVDALATTSAKDIQAVATVVSDILATTSEGKPQL